MKDYFKVFKPHLNSPAEHAVTVTPSDTSDLTVASRAIYIGSGGDLKVDMVGGETVTFYNIVSGLYPYRITRVYATGTTASQILSLY